MKTINVRIEFDETKQNNVVDIIRELGICESATELPPQGERGGQILFSRRMEISREAKEWLSQHPNVTRDVKGIVTVLQILGYLKDKEQPAAPVAPDGEEAIGHADCKGCADEFNPSSQGICFGCWDTNNHPHYHPVAPAVETVAESPMNFTGNPITQEPLNRSCSTCKIQSSCSLLAGQDACGFPCWHSPAGAPCPSCEKLREENEQLTDKLDKIYGIFERILNQAKGEGVNL
jgi:hypothetical protein